jgi:hypothetical protein
MDKTPGDPDDPIEKLRAGDRQALATLFEQYRDRLRRMVERRLDARLRARLDASDVVQEAFLDVARDLDAYLADPKLPPLIWLRLRDGEGTDAEHPQVGSCEAPRHKRDHCAPCSVQTTNRFRTALLRCRQDEEKDSLARVGWEETKRKYAMGGAHPTLDSRIDF